MPKLEKPITVYLSSFDDSCEIEASATHYRDADEDHPSPWIDSWSAVDAVTGEDVDYRSDEEAALGELLDEALAVVLDAAREDDDAADYRGISGAIVGRP